MSLTMGYFLTREQIERHYSSVIEEIFNHCEGRRMVLVRDANDFKKRRWEASGPDNLLKRIKRSLDRSPDDRFMSLHPALHASIWRQTTEDGVSHDLVIDIDAKQSHVVCKEATSHAMAFLLEREIPIALKFSGGVGYHLIVPGQAFPKSIDGHPMERIFPKVGEAFHRRIISVLLQEMGKTLERGIKVDMSMSRSDHLLRAPYSIHEKTGLVSVPLTVDDYDGFEPRYAMVGRTRILENWWPDVRDDDNLRVLCNELPWQKVKGARRRGARPTFVFQANVQDLQRLRDALKRDVDIQKEMALGMIERLKRSRLWEGRFPFAPQEEALKVEKGVVRNLHIQLSGQIGSFSFQPMEPHDSLALELFLQGRKNTRSALGNRWVGDFAKKIEGHLLSESITAFAYYTPGVTYDIDFSSWKGRIGLGLCPSHPIRRANLSTVSGSITLTSNPQRGKIYSGSHQGVVDVRTETGSIVLEPPMEGLGLSVEMGSLTRQRMNSENWRAISKDEVEVIQSLGFRDTTIRYIIRISGRRTKVELG